MLLGLNAIWRHIVAANDLDRELAYRIEKLVSRLESVADKIFIKTVKAQDILTECVQLTQQFQSESTKDRIEAFFLLTRLETLVGELIQKAHEFRIKAG